MANYEYLVQFEKEIDYKQPDLHFKCPRVLALGEGDIATVAVDAACMTDVPSL